MSAPFQNTRSKTRIQKKNHEKKLLECMRLLEEPLYNACKYKRYDEIQNILDKTCPHWGSLGMGLKGACESGDMNLIQSMIDKGKDTNEPLVQLHWCMNWEPDRWDLGLDGACAGGHRHIVDLMIEKGAHDFTQGLFGACKNLQYEFVDLMISKGAEMIEMALPSACESGDLKMVEYIWERIPSPKRELRWSEVLFWALHSACESGNIEIIKFMIRNIDKIFGKYYEKPGEMDEGVRWACMNKNLETSINVIEFLITQGARPNKFSYYLDLYQTIELIKRKHKIDNIHVPVICDYQKRLEIVHEWIFENSKNISIYFDLNNLEIIKTYIAYETKSTLSEIDQRYKTR